MGRFELAHGGTLFLDEVGDLSQEAQAKLLRTLETGELQRIGAETVTQIDARVVAATNRRLDDAVNNGGFREDLFFRLNVFPIHLPPLRERLEDLPGPGCPSGRAGATPSRGQLHRGRAGALGFLLLAAATSGSWPTWSSG